jgi:hypothetical protein
MPTRRIALFAWLAAPLWAAAQVTHNGPSVNDYGPNSQTSPNVSQNQSPSAPRSATFTTINGVTGEVVPDPAATPPAATGPSAAPPAQENPAPLAASTPPATPASAFVSGDYSAVPLTSDPKQIDNTHKLQPGDQFIYQVVEDQDKPSLLSVDVKGQVNNVPYLLDPIKVSNSTLREVVAALKDRLTDANLAPDDPNRLELYKTATIRVALYQSDQSRGHVTITGAVMKPSLIPIPSDHLLTLADAIHAAANYSPSADLKHVTIIQQTDDPDKPVKIVVDVAALADKGKEPENTLGSGDTINVPSMTETNGYIWVTGEIRASPGVRIQLPANEPFTVAQAIVDAGWTDFSKHTVFLERWETDKNGKEQLHKYPEDVDAVLLKDQKDQDLVLKPGDLVYVDWSIFASR